MGGRRAASSAARTASTTEAAAASAGVLAVDDDPAVLDTWEKVLAANGYEVLRAASAGEAIERMAERQHRPVAYAIIDDRLCDSSGLGLVKVLSALDPALTIALVSGCATTERWVEAGRVGVSVIPKPLAADDVRALLRLLERWLADASPVVRAGGPARANDDADVLPVLVRVSEGVRAPDGRVRRLTRSEREIFDRVASRGGAPIALHELTDKGDLKGLNVVYQHLSKIRRKLGPWGVLLVTLRGIGYHLLARVEQAPGGKLQT